MLRSSWGNPQPPAPSDSPMLRSCYMGQFATTFFNTTHHFNICCDMFQVVATLFQHCYSVLPKKLFQIISCNITFKHTYIRRDCWILGLASKSTNKSTEERLVVGPSPLIRKVNTSWKVWWIFFALKSWSKETMLSV